MNILIFESFYCEKFAYRISYARRAVPQRTRSDIPSNQFSCTFFIDHMFAHIYLKYCRLHDHISIWISKVKNKIINRLAFFFNDITPLIGYSQNVRGIQHSGAKWISFFFLLIFGSNVDVIGNLDKCVRINTHIVQCKRKAYVRTIAITWTVS